MADEKIQLIYEAPGAQAFVKAAKDSEIALQRQARALNESATALQREINELRNADAPNKALIQSKQRLLQARRLEAAQVRGSISAMREEARAAKDAAGATKAMDTAARAAASGVKTLAVALAAAIGAASVGQFVRTADAFTLLRAKVANALESAREFPAVFAEIVAISNRTGIAIDGVSQAFVRLAPAAKELGVTNKQLLRFSETYLKMGQLAGATSEEIQNSMIQLSQGLAAGALRGDELRSVMEQMPGVARTIAKSMGIPFDQFRKAAEQGKITAQEVFKAILGEAEKTDEAFGKLPVTVARSFTVLANSAGLFIDKLNQATGVTGGLSGAIAKLAGWIDQLSGYVDDLTPSVKDVTDGFLRLVGTIFDVVGGILRANPLIALMVDNLNNAAAALQKLPEFLDYAAAGIDILSTKAEQGAITLRRFAQAASIAINPFKNQKDKQAEFNQNDIASAQALVASESAFQDRDLERKKRLFNRALGLGGGGASGSTEPLRLKPAKPASGKNKTDKLAQQEKQRIADLRDSLQAALKDIDVAFDQRIAQLGAFASEADKIKLEQQKSIAQQKAIVQYKQTIAALGVKTKDGLKEQAKAERDLGIEVKQGQTALIQSNNQLAKLKEEQARFTAKIEDDARKISLEANIDAQKAQYEEFSQQVEDAFKRNEISARQYYDTQRDLIQRNAALEIAVIDQRTAALKAENENLGKSNAEGDQNKIRENSNELLKLSKDRQAVLEKSAASARAITREEENAARAISDRVGDSFEQGVSQAIQDALNSGDVLGAVKTFARAFKESIVKELADGLARSIKPIFQPLFSSLGNAIARVTGQASGQQASGSLAPQGLTGSAVGGGAINASGARSGLSGLAGIAAPAVAGGVAAYGIGNSAGAKFGKVAGAIGGYFGGAIAGGLIGFALGGPVGAAVGAGIGSIVGTVGGIIGGGSKKAKQQAARLQKTQEFVNAQVSGADPNNLIDLDARLGAVLRYRSGSSAGVRAKRAAAQQLQALIAARQKAIDTAKKEIALQNDEIALAIAKIDAKPGSTFQQERDLAIKQIETDTAKLLEEYKDSEEMKTLILQQESLKRQQLLKEEQDAARQGVEDLQDLLQQRDDIANANVFKRLRSAEQVKADNLKGLDKDIATKILELQAQLASGVTPLDTAGLNQILSALQANAGASANLQIVINEANDPNAVREEVTRALSAFYQKAYGVKVA